MPNDLSTNNSSSSLRLARALSQVLLPMLNLRAARATSRLLPPDLNRLDLLSVKTMEFQICTRIKMLCEMSAFELRTKLNRPRTITPTADPPDMRGMPIHLRSSLRHRRHFHLRHLLRQGQKIPDPVGIPMTKGRPENLDETHRLELDRTPGLEREMSNPT